jgi:hypothetical protein
MNTMHTPEFTAEAALSYKKRCYQATEKAAAYSGTVQLAIFTLPVSTVFGPQCLFLAKRGVCRCCAIRMEPNHCLP